MTLNEDKCHLLVLGQRCDNPVTERIGSADVVNSSEEKLLGVQIDSKLSFENHVSKLCQKASNERYALARISPYMDQRKLRTLMRAFITSQFQYCPLIWMFHSRQLNKKINKIQERALRIIYKDAESTYSELLEKVLPGPVKILNFSRVKIFSLSSVSPSPNYQAIICA